jgi:betaine-aldehyde dehydrogenase
MTQATSNRARAKAVDGFFYPSAVLGTCHSGVSIVREESFGPVRTVGTFRTEAEAETRAIANDAEYGLAGAVWRSDTSKALRVAGAAG